MQFHLEAACGLCFATSHLRQAARFRSSLLVFVRGERPRGCDGHRPVSFGRKTVLPIVSQAGQVLITVLPLVCRVASAPRCLRR